MIILGKTVTRKSSALGVGQDHMLHTCAEHHQIQVTVVSLCTVAAHTTPQEIAPAGPTTTGRNPGQHHGISTVMDHIMEQILKIWEYPEEIHGILQISGQHPLRIWEITSQLVNRYTSNNVNVSFSYRDYRYATIIELDASADQV